MDTRRMTERCEWALLGLTALFLGLLLALSCRDRAEMAAPGYVETRVTVPVEAVRPDPSPLDLNAASEEELTALPGIGEALARRIVEHREAHGPFETVEGLTDVSGIGPAKLAALEGLITVEDAE
ncbi:helix-hairpin-helix domain-containing protein [uncultured Oscillibacter sp.]|uniref:ComEA family DNA-binding protein n=1 Tax=uncultured Oscillibacter sp. TaxID=876091 RepID=UPI0025DF7279|nr:helix-hairpin-helix domain-containing protein [uncultured Oscillibacter sp.]